MMCTVRVGMNQHKLEFNIKKKGEKETKKKITKSRLNYFVKSLSKGDCVFFFLMKRQGKQSYGGEGEKVARWHLLLIFLLRSWALTKS